MKNFIFIYLKPGALRDLDSIENQDNSFLVIFTRNDQVPDRNHYERSRSIEVNQDTVLNARTIKDGYLDSPILRIKIAVQYERVDDGQNNGLLLPDIMVRPLVKTNSDDLDLFNDTEELDFMASDFVSYHG